MPVQILDAYPQGTYLNTCIACRDGRKQIEGRNERVVDFNLQVDYEGFYMICETCMVEASRGLGFIVPAEAEDLRNELAVERAARKDAEHKLKGLEGMATALMNIQAQRQPQAREFPCDECDKSFDVAIALAGHRRTHQKVAV